MKNKIKVLLIALMLACTSVPMFAEQYVITCKIQVNRMIDVSSFTQLDIIDNVSRTIERELAYGSRLITYIPLLRDGYTCGVVLVFEKE
ncbi:MAG: hypothetical protein LIR46_09345 [Bacteroidota bacterium]|nr:hypothetical protein [Bacteroidota bacterium]